MDERYKASFARNGSAYQRRRYANLPFLPEVVKSLLHNKNLKIIAFEDPVDRAISHYEMAKARGEEMFLWRALLAESSRLRADKAALRRFGDSKSPP